MKDDDTLFIQNNYKGSSIDSNNLFKKSPSSPVEIIYF